MFIDKDNLTIIKRKHKKIGKEEVKVIAKIKLIVEASEAKPVAPIAPIMGLYQLNAVEFCKKFNEMTKEYEMGLPLPVLIKKNNGKIDINIKPPLLVFILWVIRNEGENIIIKIEEIYDIIKILKQFKKNINEKNIILQLLKLLENINIEYEIGV